MNLLVCATEYFPHGSGIANVAYHAVEQFKKIGVNCYVCSPTGPDIRLGSYELIEKYGILGLLFYWHQVSKFLKTNGSNFDVIWCHNPLFMNKNPSDRSLVTMHSTYYGESVKGIFPFHIQIYKRISAIIEKYCLLRFKSNIRFTGVSPNICNELINIGISKDRISYVPNGVDIDLFKPSNQKADLRNKFGICPEDLVLLSVGRLTEVKNPLKLIDIFSLVSEMVENITLVIAGNGELLAQTREFAIKKRLHNVIFLGYVDHKKDLPELYRCSDFYILLSKYEGQPLTLLEAISSGLQCIVSDIPNLHIVADAKCGIIINCSDSNIAAQNIVKYIKENHLSHNVNPRKYAEDNLDWSVIANKYLTEFRSYPHL